MDFRAVYAYEPLYGISNEIEVTTIAIDETMILEIQTTNLMKKAKKLTYAGTHIEAYT